MMQAAQDQAGAGEQPAGDAEPQAADDSEPSEKVVDAEYEEVDDDKKS